jgi:hypothetical protein
MKKITIILITFTLLSCGSYTMSTFYVKNTSNKSVNFNASVVKYSQAGPYLLNVPFIVKANDSVLARKVAMRSDLTPENWFEKFEIFPIDSLQFNDPKQTLNWKKTIDKDGKPIYTFTINK